MNLLKCVLACLFSIGIFGSFQIRAENKKNVILFLVDDLGWMDLSCQGSKFYKTPNIDKLASSGVRFTDAYSACVVCSPTRAAVLTGKYPARLMLCLLYTSPSPRDATLSRMPSSA